MDYAMSIHLEPGEYDKAQYNGAYDAVWSKNNQTMVQKWLTSELAESSVGMAASAVDPALDTVLGPLRKLAQQGGSCPGASSTSQCLLESMSASLVHSKPIVKDLIKAEVPLSAWKTNKDFARIAERFPAYMEMRNRIWESAIPPGHKWRWGPGNGSKTGSVKPMWVIKLDEKRAEERKNRGKWWK